MEPAILSNLNKGEANIVCVIGAPGVGKGTQCTRLAKELGVAHICIGDLLRGDDKDHDPEVERIMKNAGLVNYDRVRKLLNTVLEKCIRAGEKNILLDGFPRSAEQTQFFKTEGYTVKKLLHFQCPKDTLLERILKRGQTSGRVDDNAETFKIRYDRHMEQITSVTEAFAGSIVDVNCERALDDIYGDLRDLVKDIFGAKGPRP